MADNNFSAQINRAQSHALHRDPQMICMGLGVDDPLGIFGTTKGLHKKYGKHRVFDIPTSENALTGVGIGAAIHGTRVLMTHQRVDFFLLAMDQLVNNAAKWHYMFNGQMSVPLTIRLVIGRGWGQGPTHQQNLQSWFCHIPGLKVVVPSVSGDVGKLLYWSIMNNSPTIFLEHRWLHNQSCSEVADSEYELVPEFTKLRVEGEDVTILCNSYLVLESLKSQSMLSKIGVTCDIIDLSQPNDINWTLIERSISKTGRCIVCDIDHLYCSLSSEIITQIVERSFDKLKAPPKRLGLPEHPEPTSRYLTIDYYINANKITQAVGSMLNVDVRAILMPEPTHHDIPGDWFKGPF